MEIKILQVITLKNQKIKKNQRFNLTYKVLQNQDKNKSLWVKYSCWHRTVRKYKAARILLDKII